MKTKIVTLSEINRHGGILSPCHYIDGCADPAHREKPMTDQKPKPWAEVDASVEKRPELESAWHRSQREGREANQKRGAEMREQLKAREIAAARVESKSLLKREAIQKRFAPGSEAALLRDADHDAALKLDGEFTVPGKSFAPEVFVQGAWSRNGLRFATKAEAESNARHLMGRWMMVRDSRATESDEPVNYRWDDATSVLTNLETGVGRVPPRSVSL
jgi:hypothetical protein